MGMSGGDPYQPHSSRGGAIPHAGRPAPAAVVVGGVPVGTSVQLQGWVGDDLGRAVLAWERERGSERPRVTLLVYLQGVMKRHGEDLPAPPAGPGDGSAESGELLTLVAAPEVDAGLDGGVR